MKKKRSKPLLEKNEKNLLEFAIETVIQASKIALKPHKILKKIDDSPLTSADLAINQFILDRIKKYFPFQVLSEESFSRQKLENSFWVLDPIDGTGSYIKGEDDYCISLAFVYENKPILSAIYAPKTEELFHTDQIFTRKYREKKIISVSNNELNQEINIKNLSSILDIQIISSYSTLLKLARLAKGETDASFAIFPRPNWDLCAGHALLEKANCSIIDFNKKEIEYTNIIPCQTTGYFACHNDFEFRNSILDNLPQITIDFENKSFTRTKFNSAFLNENNCYGNLFGISQLVKVSKRTEIFLK